MGVLKAWGGKPGLKKQAGSVLLAAGVTMGLVVAVAGSAYRNFVMTADSFRVARVKNLMSGVEAQARVLSQQPEAYVNCASNGTTDCSLNTGFFSELSLRVIPGADCASGVGTCGITLTNLAYDPSGKVFSGLVSYQGREVTIKPLVISQVIPIEVLQMDNFHCGERDKTKPIFTGFNPTTGAPICVGFPACPNGYYAGNMAVSGHTLTCKPLPPPASCGSQSYFSSITWGGNGALNTSCVSTETPPYYGSATGTPPAAMVYVDRTPPVTVPAPPPPPPPPDPAPAAPAPATAEPPCVVANETSSGYKRTPSGSVFYYNGADAFCSFQSPQHFKNYSGLRPEDAEGVAAMPTCKRNDGACPDPGCNAGQTGVVKTPGPGGGPYYNNIYFNNGSAYCIYSSMDHLRRATGITDANTIPAREHFPVCMDDHGTCADPGEPASSSPPPPPPPAPSPTGTPEPTKTYHWQQINYGFGGAPYNQGPQCNTVGVYYPTGVCTQPDLQCITTTFEAIGGNQKWYVHRCVEQQ